MTQDAQDTNVRQSMVKAISAANTNAKAPSTLEKRNQAAAKHAEVPAYVVPPIAPTQDFAAQLAQMQAMMQQLMDTNAQLAAQNAELKKSGPSKAEKPPTISAKNCTYTCDTKTGKLTIVIDLNADIMDEETNAPKVSKSGNTTGVAQLSGSFFDKSGRKVGVSMNAYHKI